MTPERSLHDTLAWAFDGAAHLRGLMVRMGDDAFAAPSALPGWSRAHVLTHLARNADGMINLLAWARTGVPTPAYASREQRDADIETGAARPPEVIRADVADSSDRLADAVAAMPEKAWSAAVRTVQGREIPASDILWIRAREMWIHAVDLDVGAAFTDLPGPMVRELITDVAGTLSRADGCPPVRLVAVPGARPADPATGDAELSWTLGEGPDPVVVHGPAPALVSWLLGRGAGREVRTADRGPLPELPGWL